MSISLRTQSTQPRTPSTGLSAAASSQGWQPIPHINQLHPRGADQNYVNGAYNCAPAVVAMLARGHGKLGDLNDAQLIQALGQDIVTEKGTDPQGVAQMLERADVPLAGDALGANYSDADVKQHLSQGHMLIAQVRTTDRDAKDKGNAHYVLIQGMTPRGNYIVNDPLANRTYVASPEQLKKAVTKAPPDGGMLIPVSSPAEAKAALKAPSEPAAEVTAPAARPLVEPAVRKPTQTALPAVAPRRTTTQQELAADAFGPGRRPSLTEIPATLAPRVPTLAEMPAVQLPKTLAPTTLSPATLGAISASRTPTAPPVPADEPSEQAFTASDDVLKGVDTEFKKPTQRSQDKRLESNERRNHYNLDVSYSHGRRSSGRRQSSTENRSVNEAAQDLLKRKAQGDASVYDELAVLENSTSKRDQQILAVVQQSDLKDPGIGKKMSGDAF
ncbi:C39 family peptidase [Hyalangium minutum]|uniref:Peptidase C39-like domain-containing protein n=1 Tax=Hyalangium minutum TaxID=394096 RepID=A0A085WS57_9BACT|nr:C39 family peptidase [Hyalangium minutum]KFE70520.1 hypothetical protein DB31_5562 [Hyalangium minutum]